MTQGIRFPKCTQPSCDESALSFSSGCWDHTPHTEYSSLLHDKIKTPRDPGRVPLNLKKADLSHLDFSNLDLCGSVFDQSHLSNTLFVGTNLSDCSFVGARLYSCDFVGSDMRHADLTKSLIEHCSFSHSDLRSARLNEVHFHDADLMGTLLFNSMVWNTDFTGVKHLKKKNFKDPESPSRNPRAGILETNPLVAHESYRSLKHHFYRTGLYKDGGWAAYRELTMERKHYLVTKDPRFFPSLLMDILSGYAEKPSRVIVSSIAIVIFFGLTYFLLNAITPTSGGVISKTGFWDSLYFSFITFTTVGYGDLVPRPVPGFRLLTCVEAFSGPFMAGLYIFTLTRRYAAG